MRERPAADMAKYLLHRAAQRLNTADPIRESTVTSALEESLALPAGDDAYNGQRLFEPSFSETDARMLSFQMLPGGPCASAEERTDTATRAMRSLVGNHFGNEALFWFDGRSAPVRDRGHRAMGLGAWLGSGFDRKGMLEALVTYDWGPGLMDSLPAPLFKIVRLVAEALPGLRPAFSTIRCGRSSGSQQITFEVDTALPLENIKVLMDRIGLGHQHAGLMSATALILGARFTLPPNTATVTLRPTRAGMELRLDVNLDALPDPPSQFLTLLRMQMAERPASMRALEQWITAMTPDGYEGPGSVSVLSVRVRPEMPARIALYLRPATLDTPEGERNGAGRSTPQPAAAAY